MDGGPSVLPLLPAMNFPPPTIIVREEADNRTGTDNKAPGRLEKEPLQILPCAEAEQIGRELISKYHGHLVNATILYLTTNQARKRKGKPVSATTKKADPPLNTFP